MVAMGGKNDRRLVRPVQMLGSAEGALDWTLGSDFKEYENVDGCETGGTE